MKKLNISKETLAMISGGQDHDGINHRFDLSAKETECTCTCSGSDDSAFVLCDTYKTVVPTSGWWC